MARTVKWTEAATSDLEEAAKFIGRDSQFYAAAIVREARAIASSLTMWTFWHSCTVLATLILCGYVVVVQRMPALNKSLL